MWQRTISLKMQCLYVSKKAAFMVKEDDLLKEFEDTMTMMLENEEVQKELSENIKKLARPMATAAIVDEIEKLIV
jgi:UDP-N-acetylglucosamine--N-acetylmuramyl-(pentapeptide) pyrophosphoryl-undecaprenol N-acetylglucosamine transferase